MAVGDDPLVIEGGTPGPPALLAHPAGRADAEPGTPTVSQLRSDPAAWDAFVGRMPLGTVPQLTAWAEANRSKGWRAKRIVVDSPDGTIGAQLLVHGTRFSPWSRGYAARGPLARTYSAAALEAFTEEVRRAGRRLRLTHVIVDPELPRGDPAGDALVALGWRRIGHIQVNQTRVVDLTRTEEVLWSDLRSSTRKTINKSRRLGVTVHAVGPEGLPEFAELYDETASRVEAWNRMDYEGVYRAFHRRRAASIMIARDGSGSAVAALMLLTSGARIVERFGGSSRAGLDARANHLLKWESIRRSREAGFELYDMWGTHEPGVAEFKKGFGGEERFYDGAFELVTSRTGWLAHSAARRLQALAPKVRARLGAARRRS